MNILRFKKLKNWKLVLVVLLFGIVIFGIVIPGTKNVALADNNYLSKIPVDLGGTLDPTSGPTTKSTGVLLNIGVGIATFCVTLLGALVNFSLRIGNDVINLPVVQIGSQIVLNFANLGFILAIIAIAFATIFRVQSYAMKQVLWKLIVAALLVNFSLVIAGGFISVSNIFTNSFLDKIQGGDLSKGLMGILNPQSLAETKIQDLSMIDVIWDGFSYFLKYIASLFFVLVFTFLILLTFLALFIMLLIRAIYLAILLILMPIIWLLWIFPATSKHWQKWWSEFIRWNFFAPAVLFFIFLVIETGKKMEDIRAAANINNAEVAAAFGKFLTLQPDFIQYVTQLVITTGLLMGGLFAANSLGITFASTAYGWAQGAGKMFGSWVGKKGIRAGTWALRTKPVDKVTTGLRTFGLKRTGLLRLASLPVRKLGEYGMRLREAPSKFIDEAEARFDKLKPEEAALSWGVSNTPERIGLLQRLRKTKDIELLMKNGVSIDEVADTIVQMDKYKKRTKDITEVIPILDQDTYTALKKKDYVKAEENLTKFIKELSPAKFGNAQWRNIARGDLYINPEDKEEWKSKGLPMLARSIVKGSTAEGVTMMYRSFKQAERELVHENIVAQISGTDHASRLAELKNSSSPVYNPSLAKFFESQMAADLGLTLESKPGEKRSVPFPDTTTA